MLSRLLKALGLLLILLCLTAAAGAEVQRHPLLDSAFKLLEKDNIFQRRYNELTGAQVTSLFDTGMPYLYGGAPDKRLMSRYPWSVSPGDDLRLAAEKIARAQVRRLPVVEDGRLVGAVSLGDLAASGVCEMEVSRALTAISSEVKAP